MIRKTLVSLLLGGALGAPAALAQHSTIVAVNADRVFVPVGFDDNDEVQVVLDGLLPDSCHKLTTTEVAVDPESKTILITQWARRFNSFCVPVAVPFTTEANLGRLAAGDYQLKALGAADSSLTVVLAPTTGQDDFLYAPVAQVDIERHADGSYSAHLIGKLPNSCMAWQETRLLDQGQVQVLLPILNMVDGPDCHATETPFEQTVTLPAGLAPGRHLVHVRVMSGKAVNAAFTVVAPD